VNVRHIGVNAVLLHRFFVQYISTKMHLFNNWLKFNQAVFAVLVIVILFITNKPFYVHYVYILFTKC